MTRAEWLPADGLRLPGTCRSCEQPRVRAGWRFESKRKSPKSQQRGPTGSSREALLLRQHPGRLEGRAHPFTGTTSAQVTLLQQYLVLWVLVQKTQTVGPIHDGRGLAESTQKALVQREQGSFEVTAKGP